MMEETRSTPRVPMDAESSYYSLGLGVKIAQQVWGYEGEKRKKKKFFFLIFKYLCDIQMEIFKRYLKVLVNQIDGGSNPCSVIP